MAIVTVNKVKRNWHIRWSDQETKKWKQNKNINDKN